MGKFIICIAFFLPLILVSCGDGGGMVSENRSNRGYNPGVGPFDSRGNYVEAWADDKSKGRWWRKSTSSPSAIASTPKPTPKPPVIASAPTPTPRPAARPTRPAPRPPVGRPSVASKPKPRPKAVKAKPKRKSPIRYTIKKGDTLYALARKYKTSVTAIQRANGLKGTNLQIGKRLLIPRY